MKYILIILLVFSGLAGQAQTINQSLGAPNTIVTTKGNHYVDSVFRMPKRLISDVRLRDTGSVYWDISDSTINGWTGFQWLKFRAGGSFANNGLFKNGDTIKLGGDIFQSVILNTINASSINFSTLGTTNHQFPANGNAYFALANNDALVGIGTSSPTTKLDVRGIGLIASPATVYEFTGWPTSYESSFNHNVLGVFGDEPSLDILIDSQSSFNIGGITFRSLDGIIPRLPSGRFGANAGAKIEYNAFVNGGDTTSTLEFFMGDQNNTTIHLFALSGAGVHFYGNRKVFTAESAEGLAFGTAIRGVNSSQISALTDTSYFYGDAGNKPFWWFNMPTVVADTPTYRLIVQHKTNSSVFASVAWPSTSVPNANIGTGYRWLLPGTQEIKTYFAGTNIVIDSTTNANGLTASVPASAFNLDTSRNSTSATIIGQGADAVIPLVSLPANLAGLMSPVDKGRLDSLYAGLLPGDTIRLRRSSDSVYLCIAPPGGVESCEFQYIDSTSTGGGGDVVSNETSNTDGQLPLFGTQTDGKHIKKFSGTGILEANAGVVSAITTSAGIASQISDETGTGVLVFGTAPTFTTNITTPLVIGGTTASSVLNLKSTSGVGTTDEVNILTGNNGAVTAAKWMSNGQQQATNGTAGAPGYTFAGQQNMGMYRSASNVLGFSAAGNSLTFTAQTLRFGTWANGQDNQILGTDAGAGTSNRAANHMQISAGQGTGSGAASEMRFSVGTTGSSGTSLNPLSQVMRLVTTGMHLNFAPNGAVTDSILTINATAVRKVAASLFAATGSGGYVDYGTYTPTLTNVANVAVSVALNCQWMRVGNTVHVSGAFDLDATTTATLTQLGISLPIATTIAEEYHCAGVGNASGTTINETGNIRGDVSNSRAEFWIDVVTTNNQRYFFTFTYRITPS